MWKQNTTGCMVLAGVPRKHDAHEGKSLATARVFHAHPVLLACVSAGAACSMQRACERAAALALGRGCCVCMRGKRFCAFHDDERESNRARAEYASTTRCWRDCGDAARLRRRGYLPSGVLVCIDLSLVNLHAFFGFILCFRRHFRAWTPVPLHARLLRSQHGPLHCSGVGCSK